MFESLSPNGAIAAALIAPPGPDVLTALAAITPATLDPHRQVDLLIALDRQSSWLTALIQPVLVAVGDTVQALAQAGEPSFARAVGERAAHSEIAAALRLSDATAANKLALARTLTIDLPMVHADLAAGDITLAHAAAIADLTGPLSTDKARTVAERVLVRARYQTTSQLRRCLRRAVLAVEPAAAADRAKKAHAERTVEWWPREDGMAELRLIASAADVLSVFSVVNSIAQTAKTGGPKPGSPGWEPIDALRADALVAIVTQGATTTPPPSVHVTLDLATLLGLQHNPAELAGYGPIPAPLARALAADGKWRRMILDPQTGDLLDLGHTTYTPSAALARFVKTRDRTCPFPSCSRTADHGDLDHRRPYRPHDPQGGGTDRANLHPPCKNHHVLKHHGKWTFNTDKQTGAHTWTSPTGHTYPVEPIDHRPEIGVIEPTESTEPEPCPF